MKTMMSFEKRTGRVLSVTHVTIIALLALLGSTVSVTSALADPPGRVARVSFTSGSVSFRPGSLDEWSAASVNYPLTIGDHIWTDRNARSELQIGSTIVRIAPSTELSVLNLDDRTAQFRVTQGAVSVRVRSLIDGEVVEVDTPNAAVSLLQPGLYRVDVNEAGDSSVVTVRRGEAEMGGDGSAIPVRAEQSVALNGLDAPQSSVRAAASFDEFEDWCLTRDRSAENVQAVRYVSPETIGYQDLDANGRWQVVGDYGPIWFPRVRAEWAPYRFGRWVWVEPWGWTWVDEAPWGFAPFHYGRWVFMPSRGWAWVPGTIVARPVYAPALVAFVGGSTWGASFRFGVAPVAWFPLGPREAFVPAYRVTPVYVQRVNAAHVVNVTTITTNVTYINRSVPGAVTAVSRETFVRARPVAVEAVAVSREQMQTAVVVGTAAAVAPERVSIVGQAQARVVAPPAVVSARQVVVRTAPPPPPAPFAARQAILAQHPGQPVDPEAEVALRARGANAAEHPLVRERPAGAAPPPPPPPPNPAPQRPNPPAPQAAPPSPQAGTAVARPPAAGAPSEVAARHAQERTELAARHAQEHAALQAQHDEQRRAANAQQREQLQQRHQQEVKALQERQKQEREAVQKRQQDERKSK
jgi:hypothetical protein